MTEGKECLGIDCILERRALDFVFSLSSPACSCTLFSPASAFRSPQMHAVEVPHCSRKSNGVATRRARSRSSQYPSQYLGNRSQPLPDQELPRSSLTPTRYSPLGCPLTLGDICHEKRISPTFDTSGQLQYVVVRSGWGCFVRLLYR